MSLLQEEEIAFRDEDMYLGAPVEQVDDGAGFDTGVIPWKVPDVEEDDSIMRDKSATKNEPGEEAHKILFPLAWDTHKAAEDLIVPDERIQNAFIRIRAVNAKTAMWPPGPVQRERSDPHRGYLMESNMYHNPRLALISSAAPKNHVPHIKLVSDNGILQIFSTGKFLLNSQSSPYRAASALLTLMAWTERFVEFENVSHSWYRGFCVDNHVFTGKLRHKLREEVRSDPRVKQYLTEDEIKEVKKKRILEKKHIAAAKNDPGAPPMPSSSPPPAKRQKKNKNWTKGATSITLQGKSQNSVAVLYTNGTINSITGIVSIEHLYEMLLYIEELYMDYRDLDLPTVDS